MRVSHAASHIVADVAAGIRGANSGQFDMPSSAQHACQPLQLNNSADARARVLPHEIPSAVEKSSQKETSSSATCTHQRPGIMRNLCWPTAAHAALNGPVEPDAHDKPLDSLTRQPEAYIHSEFAGFYRRLVISSIFPQSFPQHAHSFWLDPSPPNALAPSRRHPLPSTEQRRTPRGAQPQCQPAARRSRSLLPYPPAAAVRSLVWSSEHVLQRADA